MTFDAVVIDDRRRTALAGYADERLIVGHHFKILVFDVLDAGVQRIDDDHRIAIKNGRRVRRKDTVVMFLYALGESSDRLGIRLDQPPFAILA